MELSICCTAALLESLRLGVSWCMQVDILEHKETQLKGTERRVHTFEQQVEQLQSEMGR